MDDLVVNSVEEMRQPIEVVQEKLLTWWESGISLLPNFVVAIIVILLFSFLGWLAKKTIRRATHRLIENRSIHNVLGSIAQIVVVGVGLFVALGLLQLDKTVTSLLAGAGVIGLALAFAFQDLAANFIAGFYMSFQRPFVPGDVIETNDTFGTVERTDLRNTIVSTPAGPIVVIPNKDIFENRLTNFTRRGFRRVDLPVGVSYGEDLERVSKIAIEAVRSLDDIEHERGVELFYQEFGASSIDFEVRFWISFRKQSDYHRARSAAILRIKKAFDEHDIMIPFPIRTLDFGIKGGKPLNEVLIRES